MQSQGPFQSWPKCHVIVSTHNRAEMSRVSLTSKMQPVRLRLNPRTQLFSSPLYRAAAQLTEHHHHMYHYLINLLTLYSRAHREHGWLLLY